MWFFKKTDLRGKTKEQRDLFRFLMFGKGMSANYFDAILARKVNDFAEVIELKALTAHGMDADEVKEIPPIKIEGNYYDANTIDRLGSDLVWRTSKYQMSYLMFSNKQMYAYSHVFDLTSLDTTERTQEFFYQDIDSIDVETQQIEYLPPRPNLHYLICGAIIAFGIILMILGSLDDIEGFFSFLLSILGLGHLVYGLFRLIFCGFKRDIVSKLFLKLTVAGNAFYCAMTPENLPAIQGMKAKIREKKN